MHVENPQSEALGIQKVSCEQVPQKLSIPELAEKGFPSDAPPQGSCSTEFPLCSALASAPQCEAWPTAPQTSTEMEQSPSMLPNSPVILGFLQPLILFVES